MNFSVYILLQAHDLYHYYKSAHVKYNKLIFTRTITANGIHTTGEDLSLGVFLQYSSNITFRNNNAKSEKVEGYWFRADTKNLDIDTSNLVWGKPLYYFEGSVPQDLSYITDAGAIYMYWVDSATVENITIDNSDIPAGELLLLDDCTNITLRHVNLTNTGFVIFEGGGHHTIEDAHISGTWLAASYTTLRNCSIEGNLPFERASKGNLVENCTIGGMVKVAHYSNNPSSATVRDCTIMGTNPAIWVENGAYLDLINSAFDGDVRLFTPEPAVLNVSWYLDVVVKDDATKNPIEGANVTVKDKYGTEVFSLTTDSNGRIPRQELLEYTQNTSSTIYYTPYTITVTKAGYSTESKTINLTGSAELAFSLKPSGLAQVGWWPYGMAHSLAISGNTLYASSGNTLLVIDVTNPASPVKTGELLGAGDPWPGGPTSGRVYAVSGSHLYVAQHEAGLLIVDVSNQSNPKLVACYHPDGLNINAVAAQENYVYLATNEGLTILDVSNPANPYLIGSLGGFSEGGIVVSGNYLYYNCGNEVKIIDISDKSNPTQVGNYTASGYVYDLAINEATLYASGYGFVDVIDVSNPVSPTKKSTYTDGLDGSYTTIAVWANYLVAAAHDNAVYIVNVSNSSSPVMLAQYNYYGGYPRNPVVSGNFVYLSIHYRGIEVINVTDPSSPKREAVYHSLLNYPANSNKIPFYGRAFRVVTSNNTAYVLDDEGLLIFDVHDSSQPTLKSYLNLDGRGWDLTFKDNLIFAACTWAGFYIIDVSDPSNPVILTHLDPPDYVLSVAVQGDYAYLGYDLISKKSIRVYDISDPSNINFVGEYVLGPAATTDIEYLGDIFVSGNYLYVADGSNGLRILDISDPANISQIGQFNDSKSKTRGVYVSGGCAYITDAYTGLRIIDVSDPINPVLKGTTPSQESITGGYVYSYQVVVSGNYAYLGGGSEGVRVVDVSDPLSPVETGYYDREDTSTVNGVYISSDGLIYVANFAGGLEILSTTITITITEVVATNITSNSATITWQTNEPSTSLVKYGTSPGDYTLQKYDSSPVTYHSITLTDLSADTTYYFVVNSTDEAGNPAQSSEHSFKTNLATGTLIGKVTDKDTGLPIEGALIEANSHQTTTNSTGGYTITLPAGNYTLTASKTGYYSSSTTVEVLANQTTTLNFQLLMIPTIKGDINQDGKVNSLDYSLLVAKWFKTTDITQEDLNKDGIVNVRDLGILMSNWKE